jgi:anti-sigma regulatory factor (Ser/Thr protein kinase)
VEALLIGEWLRRPGVVSVVDEASVSLARDRVREVGREHDVSSAVVDAMVLVASELATNQLRHARGGGIDVRAIARGGVGGLEVVARDRGSGLVDPASALDDAPRERATGSLGAGVASVRRLSDEVDFDSRVGEGLSVAARKFEADVPRRREVGIYGRPIEGERESGDAAAFVRDAAGLTVAVCDGLGHGEHAKAASDVAMKAFIDNASRSPREILEAVHPALAGTRGVVMTVARIDEVRGSIDVAAVGNVSAHLYGVRSARGFGGASFVLGSPQRALVVRSEEAPIDARESVVVFTDGVRSHVAIEDDLELLRERPIVIAQRIVEQLAREHDDVLVLVAR